jgi:predicted SprT family Zn-dependent metalloprotease
MRFNSIIEAQVYLDDSVKLWWNKAYSIWGNKIGVCPPVKFNKRLTKTAGRAFMLIPKNAINFPYMKEEIDFSLKLFMDNVENYHTNIIPHELAHFIAFRVYSETNHGMPWKKVCQMLGCSNARCHNMLC